MRTWFYGVMVSTLDFESSDPSSNLGRTCFRKKHFNAQTEICAESTPIKSNSDGVGNFELYRNMALNGGGASCLLMGNRKGVPQGGGKQQSL